jgi:hypothetical protein
MSLVSSLILIWESFLGELNSIIGLDSFDFEGSGLDQFPRKRISIVH